MLDEYVNKTHWIPKLSEPKRRNVINRKINRIVLCTMCTEQQNTAPKCCFFLKISRLFRREKRSMNGTLNVEYKICAAWCEWDSKATENAFSTPNFVHHLSAYSVVGCFNVKWNLLSHWIKLIFVCRLFIMSLLWTHHIAQFCVSFFFRSRCSILWLWVCVCECVCVFRRFVLMKSSENRVFRHNTPSQERNGTNAIWLICRLVVADIHSIRLLFAIIIPFIYISDSA